MSPDAPVLATIALDGWSGRSRQDVEVVGETRTRYRIRAIVWTRLAGRNRWLGPGEVALVPKRAVGFPAAQPTNGN